MQRFKSLAFTSCLATTGKSAAKKAKGKNKVGVKKPQSELKAKKKVLKRKAEDAIPKAPAASQSDSDSEEPGENPKH